MCVCVCVCERERDRDRERQTDRQTDRQRHRQADRQRKISLPFPNLKVFSLKDQTLMQHFISFRRNTETS